MPLSPGFTDYVEELIAGFGKVEIRRMFGGAAIYRGGVGFGILDDDIFYIKADTIFGAELKKQGCKPWSYSVKKDGTIRDIAYWSLPDTAADDGDEASALAKRSYQIAVKADAAKARARKPKKAAKKVVARGPKKTPAKKAAKKAKKK
jgi:DNA transformation protein